MTVLLVSQVYLLRLTVTMTPTLLQVIRALAMFVLMTVAISGFTTVRLGKIQVRSLALKALQAPLVRKV